MLRHLETAGNSHIEGSEVRALSGIAGSPDRPVIGGVAIAIHVRTGKQVEGMSAVVTEDGRELEVGENRAAETAGIGYNRHYNFVALIEVRKRAFARQIGVVLGAEVAVEIGGGVKGLAESVVGHHRVVGAEAF